MNKKLFISSISSLLLCASVMGGATYALFINESNVNIAVTSGTIKVVSSISNIKLYSSEYDSLNDTYTETLMDGLSFSSGGLVSIDSNSNLISLSNLNALDRLEFTIDIDNQSDVLVKYQTMISSLNDNGLFDYLQIKINDNLIDGDIIYSDWELLDIDEDPEPVIISIGLPQDVDSSIYDKSCNILYSVTAVQGNKKV